MIHYGGYAVDMLNPFPIQFLSLLAHFLLRVCVGVVLVRLGRKQVKRTGIVRIIGFLEIIGGIMFIVGFYTQIAALTMVLISLLTLLFPKRLGAEYSRSFYLLIFGASLSLLITGAGFFAFDLPL